MSTLWQVSHDFLNYASNLTKNVPGPMSDKLPNQSIEYTIGCTLLERGFLSLRGSYMCHKKIGLLFHDRGHIGSGTLLVRL